MRIIFRTDFGTRIGLGHLSRCLSIANELSSIGHEVLFISRSERFIDKNHLPKMLGSIPMLELATSSQKRTSDVATWLGASQEEDAEETLLKARELRADMIFIDHYGISQSWLNHWKQFLPVVHFSDNNSISGADFVLDYGFDSNDKKHQSSIISGSRPMLGPQFAPISSAYSHFAEFAKVAIRDKPRVLVSLGGAATVDSWNAFIKALEGFEEQYEWVFSGPQKVLSSISKLGPKIQLSFATDGLYNQFRIADFAIVNAGLSMYEMLSSGKPGFVLVTAQNQASAFRSANINQEVNGTYLTQFGHSYLNFLPFKYLSEAERKLIWLRNRAAVDHLGTKRIIAHLGLQSGVNAILRPADDSDLPFLFRLVNQHSVRLNSFNQNPITAKAHLSWFLERESMGRAIWIYEENGVPVAQCRLENTDSHTMLSYSVDENFQSRGVAYRMLRKLLDTKSIPQIILAEVKILNRASQEVLMKCGFNLRETFSDKLQFIWKSWS